jgi:NarL family two-component system response regulator LiaR
MKKIRILLVDDHPLVRKGMVAALLTEPDFEVVGECSNGEEALRNFEALDPDITLMDLVMPVMDGIEAIRLIQQSHPESKILVLTSFSTDEKVFAALQAGASGYLLKDSGPDELIAAIRQILRGESSLHPAIARKVLNGMRPAQTHSRNQELTVREREVLGFLAQGLSNPEIAERMVVSVATVHSHVSRILTKLQLESRTQAALYAIREGYTSLQPPQE